MQVMQNEGVMGARHGCKGCKMKGARHGCSRVQGVQDMGMRGANVARYERKAVTVRKFISRLW